MNQLQQWVHSSLESSNLHATIILHDTVTDESVSSNGFIVVFVVIWFHFITTLWHFVDVVRITLIAVLVHRGIPVCRLFAYLSGLYLF